MGSIPVVGRLFRTNNDTVTKSNLLVFIRATVIRDDDTLTGTTAEKYKFLREQQLQRREIKGNLTSKKLYPVVPEWPIAPDDDLAGYKATVEAIEAKRAKKAKKKNKSKSAETETE